MLRPCLVLQDIGELCLQSAQCKSGCCHRANGLSLARCAPKAAEFQACSPKVGPTLLPGLGGGGGVSPTLHCVLVPCRASMGSTTSVPVRVACPVMLIKPSWAPSPTPTSVPARTPMTPTGGGEERPPPCPSVLPLPSCLSPSPGIPGSGCGRI